MTTFTEDKSPPALLERVRTYHKQPPLLVLRITPIDPQTHTDLFTEQEIRAELRVRDVPGVHHETALLLDKGVSWPKQTLVNLAKAVQQSRGGTVVTVSGEDYIGYDCLEDFDDLVYAEEIAALEKLTCNGDTRDALYLSALTGPLSIVLAEDQGADYQLDDGLYPNTLDHLIAKGARRTRSFRLCHQGRFGPRPEQ
jgi:hypothetical protein